MCLSVGESNRLCVCALFIYFFWGGGGGGAWVEGGRGGKKQEKKETYWREDGDNSLVYQVKLNGAFLPEFRVRVSVSFLLELSFI